MPTDHDRSGSHSIHIFIKWNTFSVTLGGGFQIGERQYTVAHLDDAVTPAGVAQKFQLWVG